MVVDLTLPESSSPTIDPYKHMPDPLLQFALYVHVELDGDDEISAIERECNSDIKGCSGVERATVYDFRGQPLQASFHEHLHNVIPHRQFDPFYYVAIVDRDWKKEGVLLVTMDDGSDDDIAKVDTMKVTPSDAGLFLVNLQIANGDWEEYKEGQEDEDDEDRGDDDDRSGVTEEDDDQGNDAESGDEGGGIKDDENENEESKDDNKGSEDGNGHSTK